jgi:pimeloyl-ACP methyl ester carboxylesterase
VPYVDTAAGRLYYEYLNFTPPWRKVTPLLLHHGVALTSDFWYEWMPILAAHFPVIRFDVRGYGRSDVPEPGFDWSFEKFAADIFAVLGATGSERCHFVGESMGGTIGLWLASHHPERVTSLAVASTAYQGHRIRSLEDWEPTFRAGGGPAWSRMMMPRRLALENVDPNLARWFECEQAKAPAEVVLSQVAWLAQADLAGDVKTIQAPLLVLAPAESPFVEGAMASELQRLVPGAEIQLYPGARHGLISSHARACAWAVAEFIQRRAAHEGGPDCSSA